MCEELTPVKVQQLGKPLCPGDKNGLPLLQLESVSSTGLLWGGQKSPVMVPG